MDVTLTEWSQKLEFGMPMIDSQHKQLFDLAATFAGNGNEIRVMKTLVMLNDYIKVHFRAEEEMLAALDYPDLEAHQRHHAEFKGMLLKLLDSARQLTLDEIANEVQYLIYGWFSKHIMQVDVAYVSWMRDQPQQNKD